MREPAGSARWWAWILVAVALAGCGHGGSGERSQLVDVSWELQAIERDSGEVVPVGDPARYTVRFGADGRLDARSDCNVCSGSYAVAGTALAIRPLACTLAACPPGSLDGAYEAALSTVSSFSVAGGELVLAFAGGRLRYRAP